MVPVDLTTEVQRYIMNNLNGGRLELTGLLKYAYIYLYIFTITVKHVEEGLCVSICVWFLT